MATTLGIVEERDYKFRIAWFEDGEEGGFLGQDPADGTGSEPSDRDAWEHWSASKAARTTAPRRDGMSFFWESQSAAKSALALAKASLKHERPLPEWAQTAIANGWKAPKGWKP